MVVARPKKRGRAAQNEAELQQQQRFALQPRRKEPELPLKAVRNYISRYNLRVRQPMTFQGFLCQGSAGRLTQSGRSSHRTTYAEASAAVKDHLRAGVIKEGEAIAEFIYSVQLKDRDLKVPLETESKLKSLPEEAVEE